MTKNPLDIIERASDILRALKKGVLVPMQRSVVGAASLNIALQEAINPIGESLSRGEFKYRQGDRVMQIRNNYDKDVFNGDVGYIESQYG